MSHKRRCQKDSRCLLTDGHKRRCEITEVTAPKFRCENDHEFFSNYDLTGKPCPATGSRYSRGDYIGITSVCGKPLRPMLRRIK